MDSARTEPAASYFRFAPKGYPTGVPGQNVHIGEVVSGRTYAVRAHLAFLFKGHPDWEPSSEQAFTDQDKEQS